MKTYNELINMHIKWEKHPYSDRFFYFYDNECLILLRLNDFPDEPLLTLINGFEITDFDEYSKDWKIPFDSISK